MQLFDKLAHFSITSCKCSKFESEFLLKKDVAIYNCTLSPGIYHWINQLASGSEEHPINWNSLLSSFRGWYWQGDTATTMLSAEATTNINPTNTVNKLQKFFLLLEKNWIIQKRHYLQSLFEIIIPVLCCSILLLIRGPVIPISQPTTFAPLSTGKLNYHVWMYE